MSAHIIIRDGEPKWWTSTDIWVVPGNDPNGPPGSPIAGQPAYLWAHVANTGDTQADGTRIDFYWANPSAQMVVGVAAQIGSAIADLPVDPNGQDVLCLVPWIPEIVNGGHECVLAVAHGAGDANPIPDPLPNGYPFDPPAHDQIAQANLTVLLADKMGMPMMITVHAPPRQDKRVRITAEFGGELRGRQLELLGLDPPKWRPAPRPVVNVQLSLEPLCGGQNDHDKRGEASRKHSMQVEVHVPSGISVPVYVALSAAKLEPGHYQLVHIVEYSGEQVLGGVSYVVVKAR